MKRSELKQMIKEELLKENVDAKTEIKQNIKNLQDLLKGTEQAIAKLKKLGINVDKTLYTTGQVKLYMSNIAKDDVLNLTLWDIKSTVKNIKFVAYPRLGSFYISIIKE